MTNDNVRHFWELLWAMTDKELRARYKHTAFGFIWLLINPLLQMAVIGYIFPLFVKEPIEHYFFYLFTGLLAWNFFALSLSKTTSSIVFERNLIKKSVFPRSVIPLSIILSNLIHTLASYLLFVMPLALLGSLTPASLIFFFYGITLLILFTVGASLVTSSLNVRFRDVNFFVSAILIIWFYTTPIVYSFTQLPQKLLWLWRLNPLTTAFQLLQHALVGAPLPGPAMTAVNSAATLGVFLLGILVFRNAAKHFDDWL